MQEKESRKKCVIALNAVGIVLHIMWLMLVLVAVAVAVVVVVVLD